MLGIFLALHTWFYDGYNIQASRTILRPAQNSPLIALKFACHVRSPCRTPLNANTSRLLRSYVASKRRPFIRIAAEIDLRILYFSGENRFYSPTDLSPVASWHDPDAVSEMRPCCQHHPHCNVVLRKTLITRQWLATRF